MKTATTDLPVFRLPRTAARKLLRDGAVTALSHAIYRDGLVLVISKLNPNSKGKVPLAFANVKFLGKLRVRLVRTCKFSARKYRNGQKYCARCKRFYPVNNTHCPECGTRLRSRPKSVRRWKTVIRYDNLDLDDTGYCSTSALMGVYHGAENVHRLELVDPLTRRWEG